MQSTGTDDTERFQLGGFGEGQGIGIAVPDTEAASGEPFSSVAGSQIGECPGKSGDTFIKSRGIADPVDADPGDGTQSIKERGGERAFVVGEMLEDDVQFL